MVGRVAYDVGSLIGPRSGVGLAAAHLLDALRAEVDAPEMVPYVLSFRATLPEGTTRLPAPAALAVRWWGRASWPPMDRLLGRPDVVHGPNYVVPPARAVRVVSVYDCWFLRHPEGVHPDVQRSGRVLRRALGDGAVAHCSSEATADALRELVPGARCATIPLGPIPPSAPPVTPPARLARFLGRPFVVAIGTVERRKDVPTLIDAFGRLASELPEVELVVAGGPGNDQERVAAAIERAAPGVRARIHLLGRVDDDEKAWLLHRAAALAYPSLDEGFGFPLLEAMAAGTPVVASSAGSIPEVAGDAALLHPVGDAAALADGLTRVLSDDRRRDALIAAGRVNLDRFSWRTTARRVLDLYDALAMERRR